MSNPWSRGRPKSKAKAKPKANPWSRPKSNGQAPGGLLAGIGRKPKPVPKPLVKEDFREGGILFHNAHILGERRASRDGVVGRWGSVDVSNGDITYTFHNQFGSWMHNVEGSTMMAEPARVAMLLGIGLSQLDMSRYMTRRFESELRKQKIPTVAQQRSQIEAAAKAATEARKAAAAKPKPTPKAKAKPKPNPWTRR
jgi:hypothetical protein